MKLYHIDRFGFLHEGKKIELINNFETEKIFSKIASNYRERS